MDASGLRLDESTLPALARGCSVLGAGGGRDTGLGLAMARRAVAEYGPVPVIGVGALDPDALVMPCGMVGAPTIAEERVWSGDEGETLREVVVALHGRPVQALMCFQVGGANGLLPVMWAARLGLPLVDADGMGRAFARLDQQAMHLAGVPAGPVVLTDGRDNTLVLRPADDAWADRLARGAVATLGGVCAGALCCMRGEQVGGAAIAGSISRAVAIGGAMAAAGTEARVLAVVEALQGRVLLEGRVRDVERGIGGDLPRGAVIMEGTGAYEHRRVRIEFENEFLVALEDGAVRASVPDLVCVLASDTAAPVHAEELRHAERVTIVAAPSPDIWHTGGGLALGGPAAFGLELEYRAGGADGRVPAGELRIAIDVGTTNADAVALDDRDRIVARAKVPAAGALGAVIAAAIAQLVSSSAMPPGSVTRAVLGSAALRDAVGCRRGLCRVAVIRVGAPLTLALPPLATWPDALRSAVSAGTVVVGGGARYDGLPGDRFDEDAAAAFLAGLAGAADTVAVTSVFSPAAPEQELAAAEVVRRELGRDVAVSLSHEIGPLGLIERENATVLNAALVGAAHRLADGLGAALDAHGVAAEPFFAHNDGTVMTLEHLLRFPVLALGGGPASAMRGAAWLSGVTDAVVVDVGGAGTDVGLLVNGFPREAPSPTEIAGVRANFRTPEVLSLPFGGGTVVEPAGDRGRLGRENIGGRLREEALVFGGSTPTLTDALVAAGRVELGSHALPPRWRAALADALGEVDASVADAIARARGPTPATSVVAVGGAGALVSAGVGGPGEVIAPPDGALANAIGLAIAPAGGQAERICANRPADRRRAIDATRAEAFARAIHAGADPRGVEIVEFEETPLTYTFDPAIRIRIKAAGPRT